MVLSTNQEQAFELIRDLALGTFRLLSHTPIFQLGINLEMHFQLRSKEEWHDFGHQLAPKDQFWSDTLKNPGTSYVAIQGERPDGFIGAIKVDVQPSIKVSNGVSFRVNDHYEVDSKGDVIGCDYILNVLESEWELSQKRALGIIKNALNKIKG